MTPTDTHRYAPSPIARSAWIVLIVSTLYLCYFHNLGSIGLVGPDEPRYAWIARDMAESGDWVTPRLYGKPWFEKPVLYYWGAAASFKLFGVSEITARLPGALCALLATLSVAWLAWKFYGRETARWLLLLLPSTVAMIGFSHAAATDMPFSGLLTVAMVFAAGIVGLTRDLNSPILPRTPWLALLFFGFFLGLAVLAKGPAAILLSGGAVLFWAACTKRWRDAFGCLHPAALASFGLTALPWYILCARRNPDFFRVFLVEHNFKRFLTPEFQHVQPFWYYLPILLLALLPWSLLVLSSAASGIRALIEGRRFSSQTLFLLCWAFFPILFFSISKSKLPGYILPAVPPLVFLLARHRQQLLAAHQPATRWIFLAHGLLFVGLAIALSNTGHKILPPAGVEPSPAVAQMMLTAILGGSAAMILAVIRKVPLSFAVSLATTLLLLFQSHQLLRLLDPAVSARSSSIAARRLWTDFSAESAALWQLNRSYSYQLNFYLHRDIPGWQPGSAKPEWLFVEPRKVQEAASQGFDCGKYSVYAAVVPCKKQK